MEEFILPPLGVELGPGWVLIMDNAPKKAHAWHDATLHEPGREQFSCQDKQNTHTHTRHAKRDAYTHTETDTFHQSAGIGRVISQPACSSDLNPLDTWASSGRCSQFDTVSRSRRRGCALGMLCVLGSSSPAQMTLLSTFNRLARIVNGKACTNIHKTPLTHTYLSFFQRVWFLGTPWSQVHPHPIF